MNPCNISNLIISSIPVQRTDGGIGIVMGGGMGAVADWTRNWSVALKKLTGEMT